MKHVKLNLLLLSLTLVSCKTANGGDCEPPPCPSPNINYLSSLLINFCVSDTDQDCYEAVELSVIRFKVKNFEEVILDSIITDFESINFSIPLGGGGDFLFANENTGRAIDHVAYSYEIIVEATEDIFELNDFRFEPNDICECPSYQFESIKVNGMDQDVIDNQIILKKQ